VARATGEAALAAHNVRPDRTPSPRRASALVTAAGNAGQKENVMKTRFMALAAKPLLIAIVLLAPLCGSASAAPLVWKTLQLVNAWETYSQFSGDPAGAVDRNGIVHLKGAMFQVQVKGVQETLAFVLPPKLRPSRTVYVPVTLIVGRPGRLNITPDGLVNVQSGGAFNDAQQFTSLDGVTFAKQ
jgi:hypothetical protein